MYGCDLLMSTTVDCAVSNLGPNSYCINIPQFGCYCLVHEQVLNDRLKLILTKIHEYFLQLNPENAFRSQTIM